MPDLNACTFVALVTAYSSPSIGWLTMAVKRRSLSDAAMVLVCKVNGL